MELLHVAHDKLRRSVATCSRLARAFREWWLRPSTNELRGRKLLREWLSPEQLAQYDAHQYFDVTGRHTGKRYRIYHAIALNVYELDDAGRKVACCCFLPDAHLVADDVMLAQKIALETDERGALAVANIFLPKNAT